MYGIIGNKAVSFIMICCDMSRRVMKLPHISSFGGQTWTSMIKPKVLDIWLLRRPVFVMKIDEGHMTDTIPFYRMKIGPLFTDSERY